MAQTELNRVYVQAVDATGASLNVLSLGTKSLTSKVLIGGVGTSNIVTVEQSGITMAGPTTFTTGLSTAVLTATGNTTLINTSMANLGVTGNASIANASINILTVVGRSILQNVSTSNLGVTGNASLVSAAINTLSVVGQSTLFNVSTTALTVANNMNVGGNVSITGNVSMGTLLVSTLVSTNASINGTVNVAGATSLQALTVAGAANFYNPVNVQGSQSLTVTGNTAITGTLGVTGQTNLGTTGTGALSVVGATTINTTGSATTTIGSATSATSVGGTLGVTGQTTLAATGTGALTVVGATIVNTTGSATTTIGSGTSATSVGGTLGVTGLFTAANSSITGNGTVGGTLGVTGQTTLQNASVTGTLAVRGNCSLNGLMVAGATTINTTGSATTTIGSVSSATTVGGTLGVTGQTTLQNASVTGNLSVTGSFSMNALTTTGATQINTTGSDTTTIGSGTSATSVGGTLGVTGQTTLQNTSVTGTLAVIGNCSMNNVYVAALSVGNILGGTGSTLNIIPSTGNTTIRIGPTNYVGNAANNTTFNAETSRHTIDFSGYRDVGDPRIGARIGVINKQTYGQSGLQNLTQSTDMFFSTYPPNSAGILVADGSIERMRITDAGNVGIGTTTPTNLLEVNGKTKLGAWFMYRPSDQLSTCLGTISENVHNKFALHQNTDGSTSGLTVLNSAGSINFNILDSAKMTLANNGYLGIGTAPSFPLHVNGSVNTQNARAGTLAVLFFNANNNMNNSGFQRETIAAITGQGRSDWPHTIHSSIYANANIVSGQGFISVSDRRIKINIVDIEDDQALVQLRLIKPKTYLYKDIINRGNRPVYGFIAQEVKEVLPYASYPIKDTIPNIYETTIFSTDVLTLTFNTSELARDASGTLFTKLKIRTREGKDEFVNILDVIDEHTLRIDKDLTEWGGQLDPSGQVIPGNQIFVYGQEVNDFHTLNKDAIWTVATAALQEVDRQLQAEKEKVSDLHMTLGTVELALASETQKTARLETALEALMARVLALEQKT